MNDPRLQRIADTHGLAVVSVDYRLCPEHSHADAVTDCIVAARWLITNASAEFGTDLLLAGGESAGANLVLCALCALRDEASPPLPLPFRAVNLVYGWFDLSLSPSARAYGERRLMTTTKEYEYFAGLVCPEPAQRTQPSISPLYAELRGLPPALFSVGTEDALRDDTLFCHARYLAAGNQASIRVWPGGPHGIGHFGPHELIDAPWQALSRAHRGLPGSSARSAPRMISAHCGLVCIVRLRERSGSPAPSPPISTSTVRT